MSKRPVKRAYNSPARERTALETRRRIRAAAAKRFVREGFAAASMKAIAADAAVSERTVYLVFPSKAALLSECIQVAVRGSDDGMPLLERPESRAMFDAPPELMMRAVAERSAALFARAAGLLAVGESAGSDDPLLTEARERGRAATRADMLLVARALKRAGVIRRGLSARRAADILYALAGSEAPYLRLVEQCGWTNRQYVDALEPALTGALARAVPDRAAETPGSMTHGASAG